MWIIMNPIVIDSDKNLSLFCWLLLLQPLCSTPHPLPSVFDEKPHTHLSIQFAWKYFFLITVVNDILLNVFYVCWSLFQILFS